MLDCKIDANGDVVADGRVLGRVIGFQFAPSAEAEGEAVADLSQSVALAFEPRVARLREAVDESLTLSNDGSIRWLGDPIARIVAGETLLAPRTLILADSGLGEDAKLAIASRVDLWLAAHLKRHIGALFELDSAAGLNEDSKSIVRSLIDAAGIVDRTVVADRVKRLDQDARGALRTLGLRFGAHYIHIPSLLKPAPRALAAQLWALINGHEGELGDVLQYSASGRTSFAVDPGTRANLLLASGFRLCEDRAVRVDIIERIADLIRGALSYRPEASPGVPNAAAVGGGYFIITAAMTSLAGCSAAQFGAILRSLRFESEQQAIPPVVEAPAAVAAPVEPKAEAPAEGETTVAGDAPVEVEAVAEVTGAPDEVVAVDAEPLAPEPAVAEGEAPTEPAPVKETLYREVWRVRRAKPAAGENRRHRRGARPHAAAPAAAPAEQPPATSVVAEAPEKARGWRGRRDDSNRGGKGQERGASAEGGRDNRDRSQKHRRASGGDNPRPRPVEPTPQAPPVRKEPRVDPNSPFAKLLILKAQLEAKAK